MNENQKEIAALPSDHAGLVETAARAAFDAWWADRGAGAETSWLSTKSRWIAQQRSALEAIAALPSGYEGLVAALKPFARVAKYFDHMDDDGGSVMCNVSLSDLRNAAEAIAALGRVQPVAHVLQSELGWLDEPDHLGEPRLRKKPFEVANGEKSIPVYATPPAPQPALALIEAKPLNEWHEDDGFAVWWTLKDGGWLGEPSYIGSPLCDDWPGYHTHWTPHPAFPALASAKRFKGE